MPDLDSLGDVLVLAFVAVGALLAGLTLVERWLTTETTADAAPAAADIDELRGQDDVDSED